MFFFFSFTGDVCSEPPPLDVYFLHETVEIKKRISTTTQTCLLLFLFNFHFNVKQPEKAHFSSDHCCNLNKSVHCFIIQILFKAFRLPPRVMQSDNI